MQTGLVIIYLWIYLHATRWPNLLEKPEKRCVALSTAEAEYIAMVSAAQKSIWLQQLIGELTNSELSPMLTYEDNQSAIANYPQFHGRA